MEQPSLRGRALAALSRREYSRLELSQKLARHAPDPEELEAVLDRLERDNLLSSARFAESLVHRRSERYGNQRIVLELKQHQIDAELIRARMQALQASEPARCRIVWAKKFGELPRDFAERARQARFLASRGFTAATIEAVLSDRSSN